MGGKPGCATVPGEAEAQAAQEAQAQAEAAARAAATRYRQCQKAVPKLLAMHRTPKASEGLEQIDVMER